MVYGLAPIGFDRSHQFRPRIRQEIVVPQRRSSTLSIPTVEVPKLDSEKTCLDGVKAPVVTLEIVDILLRLPVIADHPYHARDIFIVSGDGARLAACPQVLPRIKAERSRVSHRAGTTPEALTSACIAVSREILRSVRLACVLDNEQIPALGDLQDGIHVSHLAIKMNGNDRLDWSTGAAPNRITRCRIGSTTLQVVRQRRRTHRVR